MIVFKTGRRVAMLACALSISIAGGVCAATLMENAVSARQDHFKKLGQDFKTVKDQLSAGAPDIGAIRSSAADIKALSVGLPSWFPAGSGPDSGAKTRASADIWTNAPDFAAKVKAFQIEAAKLQQASASGDVEAVQTEFKATGAACGACHQKYRLKEG